MSVPVDVFVSAPPEPLMMPLIVVFAFERISSVEMPEASVQGPLHVTGLANCVIVKVSAALVTIELAIVIGEVASGAATVNCVAVPPVNPHRIGPVPKELMLLKFNAPLVLRSTPPLNVLFPYRDKLPAMPTNCPCQTTGVIESPPIVALITRF